MKKKIFMKKWRKRSHWEPEQVTWDVNHWRNGVSVLDAESLSNRIVELSAQLLHLNNNIHLLMILLMDKVLLHSTLQCGGVNVSGIRNFSKKNRALAIYYWGGEPPRKKTSHNWLPNLNFLASTAFACLFKFKRLRNAFSAWQLFTCNLLCSLSIITACKCSM